MTHPELLSRVTAIFRDVLDDERIILTDGTTAKDIEGWDSLSHFQLINALEREFGIRFTTEEIYSFQNIGQICGLIKGKLR
ncbi:MAG: acyl carrier protein [Candidatus Wallbacteria bacterium]|nr:acyl carrier protein [Candidatus Wallbacteria bacterium]